MAPHRFEGGVAIGAELLAQRPGAIGRHRADLAPPPLQVLDLLAMRFDRLALRLRRREPGGLAHQRGHRLEPLLAFAPALLARLAPPVLEHRVGAAETGPALVVGPEVDRRFAPTLVERLEGLVGVTPVLALTQRLGFGDQSIDRRERLRPQLRACVLRRLLRRCLGCDRLTDHARDQHGVGLFEFVDIVRTRFARVRPGVPQLRCQRLAFIRRGGPGRSRPFLPRAEQLAPTRGGRGHRLGLRRGLGATLFELIAKTPQRFVHRGQFIVGRRLAVALLQGLGVAFDPDEPVVGRSHVAGHRQHPGLLYQLGERGVALLALLLARGFLALRRELGHPCFGRTAYPGGLGLLAHVLEHLALVDPRHRTLAVGTALLLDRQGRQQLLARRLHAQDPREGGLAHGLVLGLQRHGDQRALLGDLLEQLASASQRPALDLFDRDVGQLLFRHLGDGGIGMAYQLAQQVGLDHLGRRRTPDRRVAVTHRCVHQLALLGHRQLAHGRLALARIRILQRRAPQSQKSHASLLRTSLRPDASHRGFRGTDRPARGPRFINRRGYQGLRPRRSQGRPPAARRFS